MTTPRRLRPPSERRASQSAVLRAQLSLAADLRAGWLTVRDVAASRACSKTRAQSLIDSLTSAGLGVISEPDPEHKQRIRYTIPRAPERATTEAP